MIGIFASLPCTLFCNFVSMNSIFKKIYLDPKLDALYLKYAYLLKRTYFL